MADTTIIQRGAKVSWGIKASETTFGIVQSLTRTKNGDVKDYRNDTGQVCTRVVYNKGETVSFSTIVPESDVTPPVIGEVITIDGSQWIVESSDKQWSNEDATKINIVAKVFEGINLASEV